MFCWPLPDPKRTSLSAASTTSWRNFENYLEELEDRANVVKNTRENYIFVTARAEDWPRILKETCILRLRSAVEHYDAEEITVHPYLEMRPGWRA